MFPEIGFGSYNIPPSQTARCVREALEVGYRLIDTASFYENERETMQGIRNFLRAHPEVSRSEITYTSKLWDDSFGDKTDAGVEDSVQRAGEPIDLYLLHDSGSGFVERKQTWLAMEAQVKKGNLKHIGVSNWGVVHLEELKQYATIMPLVNQIEVNPWKRMDDLVDYCHKNNIIVECYSPLILGKKLDDLALQELGVEHKKSPAQVLLRYLVQRKIVPLPKSVSQHRMKENFDIFDFELSSDEMSRLGNPEDYLMAVSGWDPTKWP